MLRSWLILDELISIVLGFGTAYNPSKPTLKVEALKSLSVTAKESFVGVNSAFPAYNNAVAASETAFASLS